MGGGQADNLVFDLSTGKRSTLPASTLQPDRDYWYSSASYGSLVRYAGSSVGPDDVEIAYFDPVTLASTGTPVRISKYMVPPKLSPDGRLGAVRRCLTSSWR